MSKDPLEARNLAGEYFRNGYNCSEAMFLTFRDLLQLDVPREMVCMATGMGGGMGHAGCICGALNGGAMVLGLLRGRKSAEEKRDEAYALSREFHDRFEANFKYTCCRNLNPHSFDTKEHLRNCIKITGNTAKLLTEFLNEKELAV